VDEHGTAASSQRAHTCQRCRAAWNATFEAHVWGDADAVRQAAVNTACQTMPVARAGGCVASSR
jgi:hypothetical protein